MPNTPVNVIVNSSLAPARISAFSDSFTIVNSSATSTVWIGDDPSVHTGTGIKLAPLASCRRMAGVQTFAILDTASTDPASLLLSFTVDQYQDPYSVALALQNSGLVLVDSPTIVIPVTFVPSTADNWFPSASGLYDVRTLQSIYVGYFPNGVNHTVNLTFNWYGSINATAFDFVGADTFGWSSGNFSTLAGRQLPVRGSYLRVNAFITGGGYAATDRIEVVGSHRLWTPVAQNLGARAIQTATANMAAGAGAVLASNTRYDGPAVLMAQQFGAAAATCPLTAEVFDLVTGMLVYGGKSIDFATGGNNVSYLFAQIMLPRNSWQVNLTNFGASIQTYRFQLTAAPEGT